MDIKFEKIPLKTARDGQEEKTEDTEMVIKEQWIQLRISQCKIFRMRNEMEKLEDKDQAQFSDILNTEKTQNILATNYVYEEMNNLLTDKESFLGLWQERSNGQLQQNSKYTTQRLTRKGGTEGKEEVDSFDPVINDIELQRVREVPP